MSKASTSTTNPYISLMKTAWKYAKDEKRRIEEGIDVMLSDFKEEEVYRLFLGRPTIAILPNRSFYQGIAIRTKPPPAMPA